MLLFPFLGGGGGGGEFKGGPPPFFFFFFFVFVGGGGGGGGGGVRNLSVTLLLVFSYLRIQFERCKDHFLPVR